MGHSGERFVGSAHWAVNPGCMLSHTKSTFTRLPMMRTLIELAFAVGLIIIITALLPIGYILDKVFDI
jgi:hypothetical protein